MRLRLNASGPVVVRDLLKDGGNGLQVKADQEEVTIPLKGEKARLLHIQPAS